MIVTKVNVYGYIITCILIAKWLHDRKIIEPVLWLIRWLINNGMWVLIKGASLKSKQLISTVRHLFTKPTASSPRAKGGERSRWAEEDRVGPDQWKVKMASAIIIRGRSTRGWANAAIKLRRWWSSRESAFTTSLRLGVAWTRSISFPILMLGGSPQRGKYATGTCSRTSSFGMCLNPGRWLARRVDCRAFPNGHLCELSHEVYIWTLRLPDIVTLSGMCIIRACERKLDKGTHLQTSQVTAKVFKSRSRNHFMRHDLWP